MPATRSRVLAAALIALLPVAAARAQYVWTGEVNTVWDTTTANWSGAGSTWVNADTSDAVFSIGTDQTTTLGADITAGSLTFSANGYSIDGGGFTLTLGGSSVGVNGSVLATLGMIIADSGAVGLAKGGSGSLVLANPGNIYAGNTVLAQGSLGTASVADVGFASGIGAGSSIVFVGEAEFAYTNTSVNGFTDRTVALVNNGTSTIGVSEAGVVLTLTGGVSGGTAGTLDKVGDGVLSLTASNAYEATTTTVSAGVLRAVNGVGLPSASRLDIDGGIFESSGSFTRSLGTGSGEVRVLSGGFSANGGPLTVNLGGVGAAIDPFTSDDFKTPALTLNAATADSPLTFVNGLILPFGYTVSVVANTATLSGPLTNGGLTKEGAGTLVISGMANTYTGGTTVLAGTLRVDGSLSHSDVVYVQNDSTLGGSGTIQNLVTVFGGATLAPGGAGGGQLTLNNGFDLDGGTYAVTLDGTAAGSEYTLVRSTGGIVNLRDQVQGSLSVALGFAPSSTDAFGIIWNDGSTLSGHFTQGSSGTAMFDGTPYSFAISYTGQFDGTSVTSLTGGNDVVLYDFIPVPEPACLFMAAGVVAACALISVRGSFVCGARPRLPGRPTRVIG